MGCGRVRQSLSRLQPSCGNQTRNEEEAMSHAIGDDERRRMSSQPPCALRVTAVRGHLLRRRSSPMRSGIAFVAPSWIWPRRARNAARTMTRTGSKG